MYTFIFKTGSWKSAYILINIEHIYKKSIPFGKER
jgi:hypothetical protein